MRHHTQLIKDGIYQTDSLDPYEETLINNVTQGEYLVVINYIATGNRKQSLMAAGYSMSTSLSNILKKPNVSALMTHIQSKIDKSKIMQAQELMEALSSFCRGEITEEVLVKVSDTNVVRQYQRRISPKDQLKALELLAKIQGLLSETNVSINNNINNNMIVPRIVDDIKPT